MTPDLFVSSALVPALRLLPSAMDTPQARALLLAIARQESRLLYRRQIRGPARSYFQFERAGVHGVLTYPATQGEAERICAELDILPTLEQVYVAIEFNDLLACAFARLLLWTVPERLPQPHELEKGWTQYLAAWRPGKPRRDTWTRWFAEGWRVVQGIPSIDVDIGSDVPGGGAS